MVLFHLHVMYGFKTVVGIKSCKFALYKYINIMLLDRQLNQTKVFAIVITLMLIMPFYAIAQKQVSLDVMSWNIRLDVKDDGKNQWDFRKDDFAAKITDISPDIIGLQEVMHHQLHYLKKNLKGYKSLGVARDDGKKAGEYSPLLYKKKKLRVVRSGTFWLSETPEIPGSRGWDAACNRVVTWAEFKHKKTGEHFLAFNTHFDHMGDTARVESAQLLIRKIAQLAGKLPVVLTGDFNVTEKHRAYRIISYPENEVVMVDSRVRALEKTGPEVSYISFDPEFDNPTLIDFIFVSYDTEVLTNSIIDFRSSGKYLSDHLPVLARIRF